MSSLEIDPTHRSPLAQLSEGPIFIVGAARSGTTWVYDILTCHELVCGVYESWLFTPQSGLGALFAQARWGSRPSGLGRLMDRQTLMKEIRRFADRVLAQPLEPQQRYLVEKSPSHVFQMDLIHEVYPTARFIHVLRDGRDVSVSVRAAAKSWVPQWGRTFGKSILTSGRAWRQAVRCARRLAGDLDDRYYEIRFESIKRDPFTAYRELFEFCCIPYTDGTLQQVYKRTDFELNYRAKEDAFRRSGRVGDWKTQFGLWDSLLFNFAAGDTLIETGYETDRFWFSPMLWKLPAGAEGDGHS